MSESDLPVLSIKAVPRLENEESVTQQSRVHIFPTTIHNLPKILVQNKEYVLEKWLIRKRSANRTSWIYDYGTTLITFDTTQRAFWSCNLCDAISKCTLYPADSKNDVKKHLTRNHGDKIDEQDSDDTVTSSSVLDSRRNSASKRPFLAEPAADKAKDAFIEWMTSAPVPFAAVDNDYFRQFLFGTSTSTLDLFPPYADTIRGWIMEQYTASKAGMKRKIQGQRHGMIHISLDVWTSSNSLAMLAVVAHYEDTHRPVQARLLGLRRLRGVHSGENVAEIVLEILGEYDITNRLGFLVCDNVDASDVAVELILKTALPELTPAQRKERRIRCWGHILNLAAKAVLFGEDPDAFEREDAVNRALGRLEAELRAWRECGAVGKLHNLIVLNHRELFLQLCGEEDVRVLTAIVDDATRWNATYSVMERALTLRPAFDRFVNGLEPDAKEDHLDYEDWRVIAETTTFLNPFYTETKRLESNTATGSHGSLRETLPSMKLIMTHLETLKARYAVDLPLTHDGTEQEGGAYTEESRRHFRTIINNSWMKLDEYSRLTGDSPAYAAAVVLHPAFKWEYLEAKWTGAAGEEWLAATKIAVRRFYEENWKGKIDHRSTERFGDGDDDDHPSSPAGDLEDFEQFSFPPKRSPNESEFKLLDEYESYISEKRDLKATSVNWWWENRSERWPNLARMALDLLSIPGMSTECERAFSSTGHIIPSQLCPRGGLTDETVEAVEVLRRWQKMTRMVAGYPE